MCMRLFSIFFSIIKHHIFVDKGSTRTKGNRCCVVLLRETLRVPGRINFLFGGPVHANELRGGRCILFTLILLIGLFMGV